MPRPAPQLKQTSQQNPELDKAQRERLTNKAAPGGVAVRRPTRPQCRRAVEPEERAELNQPAGGALGVRQGADGMDRSLEQGALARPSSDPPLRVAFATTHPQEAMLQPSTAQGLVKLKFT